jgi:hypothetical protein
MEEGVFDRPCRSDSDSTPRKRFLFSGFLFGSGLNLCIFPRPAGSFCEAFLFAYVIAELGMTKAWQSRAFINVIASLNEVKA